MGASLKGIQEKCDILLRPGQTRKVSSLTAFSLKENISEVSLKIYLFLFFITNFYWLIVGLQGCVIL